MPDGAGLKEVAARLPVPIRLGWLEELDRTQAPGSLPDAVGDGYLCAHNPLYAAIRRAALDCGYSFSHADSPLWRDYAFLPLSTIDRILDGCVIPYADSWAPLRSLIAADAGASMPIGILTANLRRNFLLHESAHALAHVVLRSLEHELAAVCPDRAHSLVIAAILGESFANAVETIASDFSHHPVVDEVFYALNSYTRPGSRARDTLRQSVAEWGEPLRLFRFLAGYFESNLAPGKAVAPEALARIAAATQASSENDELLAQVVKVSFSLSDRFRENTTPYYFESNGLAREYKAAIAAPWLEKEERRAFLSVFAGKLWSFLRKDAGPSTSLGTTR